MHLKMIHRWHIRPCYLQKHSAGLGCEQNDGFLTSFDFLHHRIDKLQSFVLFFDAVDHMEKHLGQRERINSEMRIKEERTIPFK